MIKFEKNGTIYQCDTAEEAARLSLLLDQESNFPESDTAKLARLALGPTIVDASEKAELIEFLNIIKPLPQNKVSGEFLADVLGLEGVTGLGPRLGGLAKKFSKYGIDLWDILKKETRPGSPTAWIINKEAIDKLYIFQQAIHP